MKNQLNQTRIALKFAFLMLCSVFGINQTTFAQIVLDTLLIPNNLGISSLQIRAKTDMKATSNGEIWLALQTKGLVHYNGTTWSAINQSNSSLPSDSLYKLHIDASSNLWIGSKLGLILKGTSFITYPFNGNTFPNSKINAINSTSTEIVVGGNLGISIFNLANQTWTLYNTSNSALVNDTINCLFNDNTGKIWIGTNNGYAAYSNGNLITFNNTNSLFPQEQVKEIISTPSNTLFKTQNLGILKLQNINYISLDSIYFGKTIPNFCGLTNYYILEWNYNIDNRSLLTIGQNNQIYFIRSNNSNPNSSLYLFMLDDNGSLFQKPLPYYNYGPLSLFSYLTTFKNDSLIYYLGPVSGSPIFEINKVSALDSFINVTPNPLPSSYYMPVNVPPSYVGNAQTDLIGNRVRARILNKGDLHWDPIAQVPHYEVPIGSNLGTIYSSAIWFGGIDASGLLRVACQTYRQSGTDFWPGPLDSNGEADLIVSNEFDHIWMANRADIDAFRYQYALGNVQNGTYAISNFIATWPAYYTAAPNYPQRLAPFFDFNGDNLYNPMDGDYPEIKGDQMAWWIFNDELYPKTETNSQSMKIEIHASAYSLNCNSDSNSTRGLNYTTFYHYTLYNRSFDDYNSCYFGMWSDPDLGNAADDYMGCHVGLNTFYAYNGDNDDDGGQGYGTCPPRQNVTFLNGPIAPLNDGEDNDHDGLVDEVSERIGLSKFMYYTNTNGIPTGNPSVIDNYYDYLIGQWLDGTIVTYGGDGRNPGNGNTGIPTSFMFPDNSDVNFSTPWNMANGGIQPTDMRGLGSYGPFFIAAGDSLSFDFAFITGPNDKVANENVVASVINKFSTGELNGLHNIPTTIQGPTNVAGLNTVNYNVALDTSLYTFIWTVQNGSIVSGQGTNSIDVTWANNDTGFVSLEILQNGNICKGSERLTVFIGTVGLDEISSDIIVRMYPNPTNSVLNIETKNNTIEQYCIYNLQGQLVKCASYSNLINTDELQSGAYILELRNKSNESLVRKLFIRQ